ncbi:MAG: accessory factor UbiK family protein [Sneathiella sp.]
MQTNSRVFDDLAKLASGALGTAQGVKTEWENLFNQRIEKMISGMNLVPREEFDAVKAMVVSLTEIVEAQSEKIAKLEKNSAPKKAPKTANKTSNENKKSAD